MCTCVHVSYNLSPHCINCKLASAFTVQSRPAHPSTSSFSPTLTSGDNESHAPTAQSKLLSGTFPPWITPTQLLGIAESHALNRLLTALTTKTIPCTHIQSTSASEIIAKHVRYVLVVYIDAMNDPLYLVSPDMRRELQPGLISLCVMLGKHS